MHGRKSPVRGGEGMRRDRVAHLSRGSFFPLIRMRSAALGPPPARAAARFASRSATRLSMASARARNSGDEDETREGRTEAAWYDRAAAGGNMVACWDAHLLDGVSGVVVAQLQRPACRRRREYRMNHFDARLAKNDERETDLS